MKSVVIDNGKVITDAELRQALEQALSGLNLKKVLLIPPDFTRRHSFAGKITAMSADILGKDACIDVLPALGTHEPMTEAECAAFFGPGVPMSRIINHDWRNDVVKIGEVPGEFVAEVSEGLVKTPVDVEINRLLLDKSYDLILSAGQAVPHEVVGMANYSKNIFVGCGGSSMINASHMLGAFYGMERIMGRDKTPVRRVFDYAEERFLKDVPLMYALTVATAEGGEPALHGLFIGRERALFEQAVKLSRQKNIIFVDKPLGKAAVYLDPREFKSAWLGNKAIYRTRMAMADGGELTILAPGVKKFGEDAANDALIRKYGYAGRKNVLRLCEENGDLRANLSVAAHLIHGSPDGRFSVAYAAGGLTKQEVERAGFIHGDIDAEIKRFDINSLKDGFNTLANGEEVYYISNPALGLWADRGRFAD